MKLIKQIKQNIFLALGMGLLIVACQEPITLNTEDSAPQVVVEGLITNSDLNYVRISRSRTFYASGSAEAIENATVVVSDGSGTDYVFEHNPEDKEELAGVYLPPAGFLATIGETYQLSIIVDGTEYNAEETLHPVTEIDSLTVEYAEFDQDEEVDEDDLYEVIFFAKEPQDRVDHYLFKFYKNDTLIKDSEEDIYFSEDEFLGEEIDDLPIAGYYAVDDTVRVEMYSITREAFVYYADLFNLINGDGGMFSPPPANPRNNLSNGALGYFQVSAIDSETIIVKEPEED